MAEDEFVCEHERTMTVGAKVNDGCSITLDDQRHVGYVPDMLNIGGGDYLEFEVCADCGQMMGRWPLPNKALSKSDVYNPPSETPVLQNIIRPAESPQRKLGQVVEVPVAKLCNLTWA